MYHRGKKRGLIFLVQLKQRNWCSFSKMRHPSPFQSTKLHAPGKSLLTEQHAFLLKCSLSPNSTESVIEYYSHDSSSSRIVLKTQLSSTWTPVEFTSAFPGVFLYFAYIYIYIILFFSWRGQFSLSTLWKGIHLSSWPSGRFCSKCQRE